VQVFHPPVGEVIVIAVMVDRIVDILILLILGI